jgi:hypothetical protein
MITDDGEYRFFDFERSSIGLKVEDLVRIYQIAEEHGCEEEIKQYFYGAALGADCDIDEVEEMFCLVRAMYHLENINYYWSKTESEDDEENSAWTEKAFKAESIVEECLKPYIPEGNFQTIMQYINPEYDEIQEAA